MDRLEPAQTALFIVDIQEKLAPAMPPDALARVLKNVTILVEAARVLGMPIIASEQYPKGLGPTVAPVAALLSGLAVTPMPKVTFDACADLGVALALAKLAPRAVIVVGMEAHVCVFQTARSLVNRGIDTHVPWDSVASRLEDNRLRGLELAERAGATVTTTETAVFDLMHQAGTAEFKALSKLLK